MPFLAGKTFLVGLTLVVKHLCHYITLHRSRMVEVLTSELPSDKVAVVTAMFDAVVAACSILEALTGY